MQIIDTCTCISFRSVLIKTEELKEREREREGERERERERGGRFIIAWTIMYPFILFLSSSQVSQEGS